MSTRLPFNEDMLSEEQLAKLEDLKKLQDHNYSPLAQPVVFKEGIKLDISWMIDRTFNLAIWMHQGRSEIQGWGVSNVLLPSREKLWEMCRGGAVYDIKQEEYHSYYYNNASGVIIGGTLIQYDKPGSFLVGYIGAAGGVSLQDTQNDTRTFQEFDSGENYDVEDENIDQQYIVAGYNYYLKYKDNITPETLGEAFRIVRNETGSIVPRF